jgi:hypothetical protein
MFGFLQLGGLNLDGQLDLMIFKSFLFDIQIIIPL